MSGQVAIEALDAAGLTREAEALARILRDSVAAGAAIGFLHPLAREAALAFWLGPVQAGLAEGTRHLLVARDGERTLGTVQVLTGMPQNQPHRAEIAKMIVHPEARRRGIGRALMLAALEVARGAGKTLVTLDTRTGDAAEPLYASVGFAVAGVIPGYALDTDGATPHATTYMYRAL